MAKYGFKGRLGARETGIVAPVEQVPRPAKLGLGAGSFSEKTAVKEVVANIRENDIATQLRAGGDEETVEKRGRKKNATSKKRPRNSHEILVFDTPSGQPRRVDNIAEAVASFSVGSDAKKGEKLSERTFVTPDIVYNLRVLRDQARVQLDDTKRRIATEELILNSTNNEARKLQAKLDEMKGSLTEITDFETELRQLQQCLMEDAEGDVTEDDHFTQVVKRFVTVLQRAKNIESLPTSTFSAALSEVVCGAVQRRFKVCMSPSAQKGRSRRKIAKCICNILNFARGALTEEDYIGLCTRAVLVQLRRQISGAAWDAVSGAWIADVISELTDALPDIVIGVFAEEVLVPRLVARLGNVRSLQREDQSVEVHLWVHPWLPVVGRRRLSEVLGRVRVILTKRLEAWEITDCPSQTAALAGLVGTWEGVLSRRKVQMALIRHIFPKLARAVGVFCRGAEVGRYSSADCLEKPSCFVAVYTWAAVCSSRLIGRELVHPAFEGLALWMRDFLFDDYEEEESDGLWECATQYYKKWQSWIPSKMLPHVREGLAAVLFVLHAGRVVKSTADRCVLSRAEVRGLLRNRFSAVEEKKSIDPKAEHEEAKASGEKMGLKEVLEHIARREGLAIIGGIRGSDGMPLLKVGNVPVRIDGRRGLLVLAPGSARAGKVVGVEEVVELAKTELRS